MIKITAKLQGKFLKALATYQGFKTLTGEGAIWSSLSGVDQVTPEPMKLIKM